MNLYFITGCVAFALFLGAIIIKKIESRHYAAMNLYFLTGCLAVVLFIGFLILNHWAHLR